MGITMKGVNLGFMGLDKSLLLNAPEASGVPYQCPAIAYIIDTPDGRLLWETGISDRGVEEWLPGWQELVDLSTAPPEVCLENRLKQLGMGPDDFRWVVQGHLHTDHAGGLRLFEDANVEIVVHEDEFAHVQAMQEDSANFWSKVDFAFLDGVKPTLVSGDDTELTKDVRLISLPGHTPGQMGLLVRLETTGWVMLTSDAMYLHESYGTPPIGSNIVWQADTWIDSVEKIRRIATEHEALIFPGHDDTLVKQFADHTELQGFQFWPGYEYA